MPDIIPASPATSGRRSPQTARQNPRPALSSSEHVGRMIGRGEAPMFPTQRLPASLTLLEAALAALLDRLEAVGPLVLLLAGALGRVAPHMLRFKGLSPRDIAPRHRWALARRR